MKRLVATIALAFVLLAVGVWFFKIREKRAQFSSAADVFFYTLYFFEDATTFSRDFSEAKFKTVHSGQTQQEVQVVLGKPLSKDTDEKRHQEYWRYSEAPNDRNYWLRVIVFGADGRVKEVDRHYFVD
jgi:outer membrane protein assembly factor BamE (lipoprotein component of BamABCDE complex)